MICDFLFASVYRRILFNHEAFQATPSGASIVHGYRRLSSRIHYRRWLQQPHIFRVMTLVRELRSFPSNYQFLDTVNARET